MNDEQFKEFTRNRRLGSIAELVGRTMLSLPVASHETAGCSSGPDIEATVADLAADVSDTVSSKFDGPTVNPCRESFRIIEAKIEAEAERLGAIHWEFDYDAGPGADGIPVVFYIPEPQTEDDR